jgi:DNA-binding XRE family transcriptional regulator
VTGRQSEHQVIICDCRLGVFWFQLAKVKNEVALLAFGQHLRRLRERRAWSQQALADAADITKKTIYRMETAQTAPNAGRARLSSRGNGNFAGGTGDVLAR